MRIKPFHGYPDKVLRASVVLTGCMQAYMKILKVTNRFRLCCGRKGHALTAASEMEVNPAHMACCNAVMLIILPWLPFPFIVMLLLALHKPERFLFIFRCVSFSIRVCVSVSQRSRYSIRTEQWQRASKDYKKQQINAYGTHTLTNTHSEKVFSWHSEQLSGLKRERGGRQEANIKTEEAVETKGDQFYFDYLRWN